MPIVIVRVALKERISRNDQLINVDRLGGGGEAAAIEQSLNRLQRVKPVFELFVACVFIDTSALGVTDRHVFLPSVGVGVDAAGVEFLKENDGQAVSSFHGVVEHVASVELSFEVVVKDTLAGLDEFAAVGFLHLVRPLDHVDARNTGQLDQAFRGLEDEAHLAR